MKAWHVINENFTLNHDLSGTEVYPGLELFYEGDLELCRSGLHASVNLLDALKYGNSNVICRVEVGEDFVEGDDKLVSNYRKVLSVGDCTEILQQFAIEVAEDVLPIFEAEYPDDIRPRKAIEAAKAYLAGEITIEELDAARSAADAARSAAAAAAADAAADAADAADAARSAVVYVAYAVDAAHAAAARAAASAAAASFAAAYSAAYSAAYVADTVYDKYNSQLETKIKTYLGVD